MIAANNPERLRISLAPMPDFTNEPGRLDLLVRWPEGGRNYFEACEICPAGALPEELAHARRVLAKKGDPTGQRTAWINEQEEAQAALESGSRQVVRGGNIYVPEEAAELTPERAAALFRAVLRIKAPALAEVELSGPQPSPGSRHPAGSDLEPAQPEHLLARCLEPSLSEWFADYFAGKVEVEPHVPLEFLREHPGT